MNRTEVLERLEPAMNLQVRPIEHRPQTRVLVAPEMTSFQPGGGAHHMEVTQPGLESMAKFVGLPWNLATNLRPETLGEVTTELLGQKHRYALVTKDGAVTGVAKAGEFHNLNAGRVLQSIEAGVRGAEFHRVLVLDNFVVSLEVIGEKREAVARGDLIQAGANITFSPLGTVNPTVQSYALRLACTNGQVSNTILREFRYGSGGGGGEGDDIWQWFRNSSRQAYNAIDRIVSRYREMLNENIAPGDRATMLEAMLREARITGETANAIRALAIENPPENSYQLMNLFTNATSHIIENPRQVRRAQLQLAQFTSDNEHSRVCPVCHSRRN